MNFSMFTRLYSHCACVLSHFSHVRLFVTLWTVACQAPLSMGFSRQEYWSVLPFPTPRNLSNPEIEPVSVVSPALVGGFFTTGNPILMLMLLLLSHFSRV